jgi:hypothetical protein
MASLGSQAKFRYRWLPFLLNPSTPEAGMSIQDYLQMKGWHPDRYPQVKQRLDRMGKEAGVIFNAKGKGNGNTVINTLDSIRLIDYAQATLPNDEANTFVEAVVWAHHVDGKDISDHEQLSQIGVDFGLLHDPLLTFLKDSTAFAPVPGSKEAMAAIADTAIADLLTCGNDKDKTCGNDNREELEENTAITTGKAHNPEEMQLSTNETFNKIGDAHSVKLRDLEAKRNGIHAVPHIEIWRETSPGEHGKDCKVASPSRKQFITTKKGGVTGLFKDAVVISGAMPVEHFLAAFKELASMSVVLEER